MSTIQQVSKEYRARLQDQEAEASQQLIKGYRAAVVEIEKQSDVLLQAIEAKRATGEAISVSWLKKEERYQALLQQVKVQIGHFSGEANHVISAGQQAAVQLGQQGAEEMADAALKRMAKRTKRWLAEQLGTQPNLQAVDGFAQVGYTWNQVPTAALEHLVGTLGDGSPLKSLLDELGPQAAEAIGQELQTSIVMGRGPRETARKIREELGGNMSRALTISRTEQLRSYRAATLDSYQANSDVVEGWTRVETLDELTCLICIEENGTVYALEEDFETHPNCRGTLVPNIKGDKNDDVQKGTDWFADQSEAFQREKLGDERFEHYQNDMSLSDMIERTEDPDWGGGRRLLSLDELSEKASGS